MTRKTRKPAAKPAVSKKPVAYRIGANTHKAASATKRNVKKAGAAVASFFRDLKSGWKAA